LASKVKAKREGEETRRKQREKERKGERHRRGWLEGYLGGLSSEVGEVACSARVVSPPMEINTKVVITVVSILPIYRSKERKKILALALVCDPINKGVPYPSIQRV